MDIVRETKKPVLTKYKWHLAVLLGTVTVIGFSQSVMTSDYSADKNNLRIATVEKGDFQVKVRGPGVLTPKNIRWIASDVEGRVERVLVKPGANVKAGELLMELSNPQLKRRLEETEWELEAQTAESIAQNVERASRLLDQQSNVLNAKLNYESISMRLTAETELFNKGAQAVSKLDYQRTKLETEQSKQRWAIEQQRLVKMKESIEAQQAASTARLNKLRKTLESMSEQVAKLRVTASIDSVVQDVAIEAGQQVVMGSNLAKLARQDELIAELQIPEMMVRDVILGQAVTIDTRNSQIKGHVSRIAPSVNNGAVQVDVALTYPLPNDARPDLSVDGEILVSSLTNTLYVQRPSFAQSNSAKKLFKLNAESTRATKTSVSFGIGSVQHIEIKNGLVAGDQIIISQNDEIDRFTSISVN